MSNPFHESEGNPFADAAVIEAAENDDDGYNNYEDEKSKKKGDKARLFSGPASDATPPPPAYADNKNNDFRKSLPPTPDQLDAQQQQQPAQGIRPPQQPQQPVQPGDKKPNWPVCRPIIYHNIPDEIPPENQRTVRNLYYSWILTVVSLGVNMIGCLCVLIAGVSPVDFGVSIMYFFVISVCAFLLWYRPVYNAFMKNTSFYFLMYLFFGGFHVLFVLYMFIGIAQSGAAGMVNMIYLFVPDSNGNKHTAEGIICLISTLFWAMLFGFCAFLYRQVYYVYKARGHSIADARNQVVTTTVTSPAGKQAMASAVTTAASAYMNPDNNA